MTYNIITYGPRVAYKGKHIVQCSGHVHTEFPFGYDGCPSREQAEKQAEELRDELNTTGASPTTSTLEVKDE